MNNSEKTVTFSCAGIIETIVNQHQDKYKSLQLKKGYLNENGQLQLVFTYEEDIKIIIKEIVSNDSD